MPLEKQTDHDTRISWAAEQAAILLAPLGNRWLHVKAIRRKSASD